ncbi:MAG: FHA domain-containing protein [Phycisphaerae bacterium]
MTRPPTAPHAHRVELPSSAPHVRLTAGLGSVGQKTWNVRRPVTLIGSRRQSHIVLHGPDINRAHCVIVNTGAHVLLKDLGSGSGTWRGEERVDLVVLSDGDVIRLGQTSIQVAIQTPVETSDDSDCGIAYVDPTCFDQTVILREAGTKNQTRLDAAVACIGRSQDVDVRVDDPQVSLAHAVIFQFGAAVAIFDLGSRTGTRVDGEVCPISLLRDRARIQIGPAAFVVSVPDAVHTPANEPTPPTEAEPPAVTAAPPARPASPRTRWPNPLRDPPPSAEEPGQTSAAAAALAQPEDLGNRAVRALGDIESDIAALQASMTKSWDRLNEVPLDGDASADGAALRSADLDAREAELDKRDAELRGLLLDLTRQYEQLVAREGDLPGALKKLRAEQKELLTLRQSLEQREQDLLQREDDLQRRERAVAQRWGRVSAAKAAGPVTKTFRHSHGG